MPRTSGAFNYYSMLAIKTSKSMEFMHLLQMK